MSTTAPYRTAHRLLIRALTDPRPSDDAEVGVEDFDRVCSWLVQRAVSVLNAAYASQGLMPELERAVVAHHGDPERPEVPLTPYAAALALVAATHTRSASAAAIAAAMRGEPATSLDALARVVALTFVLHDGPGAPAVVRALVPE